MGKEYLEALKAYDKLYRKDKLKFILSNLDILMKQDTDLDIVKEEVKEFFKMVTQSTLYKSN